MPIDNPFYTDAEVKESETLKHKPFEALRQDANLPKTIDAKAIQSNAMTKWAGEGVDLDQSEQDIQAMLLKAGLDWNTLKRPISIREDNQNYHGMDIDDHYALLRSDTGLCLDVVGNRYEPVNNAQAFSLFKDFLSAGDMKLETAGCFKEGRYVWGLAKLKHEIDLSGDKSVGYMLLSCPHVQGMSLVMKLITKRITCWNSYQAALREDTPSIKMTHKASFAGFESVARRTIEGFNDSFAEYGAESQKLLSLQMSFDEALPILENVYQFPKDYKEKRSKVFIELEDAYLKNPKNDDAPKNTAFDIFNGVTYYHTHLQGRLGSEGRLFNQFLGQGALQSRKVFNELLKIAA